MLFLNIFRFYIDAFIELTPISLVYFFPLHIYTLYYSFKGVKNIRRFLLKWLVVAMLWGLPIFFIFLGLSMGYSITLKDDIEGLITLPRTILLILIGPALLDILIYILVKNTIGKDK